MSKIIDITEKLSFDTSPVIKIKDIELKVNDDASTALKMMAIMSDSDDDAGIKDGESKQGTASSSSYVEAT